MPELPEVETVCRGLEQILKNCLIDQVELRRFDLRYPFPPLMDDRLKNTAVIKIERRAKYILMHLDSGHTWLIHLGMSGRIHELLPGETPGKHDHLIIHLQDKRRIAYNDPRRFGYMDLFPRTVLQQSVHLKHLGFEPFAAELTPQKFHSLLSKAKRPIKIVLLDQRIVVGLGNIYVCEALWQSKIHPQELACNLTLDQAKTLLFAIQEILQKAIKAGGSTLKDYRQVNGELGYFQHTFAVYDRESGACQTLACKGTIERMNQSGRSTFYCPTCQRRTS